MLDSFLGYLQRKQILRPSQREYCVRWVSELHKSCGKQPGEKIEQAQIDTYLANLADKRQDWQVQQAKDSIGLYLFFQSRFKGKTVRNQNAADSS